MVSHVRHSVCLCYRVYDISSPTVNLFSVYKENLSAAGSGFICILTTSLDLHILSSYIAEWITSCADVSRACLCLYDIISPVFNVDPRIIYSAKT